jgi:hypothetical protein
MKFKNTITIQPPPYSDNSGKIINPPLINLDNLELIFTDNPAFKTISAKTQQLPQISIIIWNNQEYDQIGDWTKTQAELKIKMLMGDDPAKYLRSLYPKTLEENPNHPGTILSKMIKSVGIQMTDSCSCKRHALEMNEAGNDWCEYNIDTVVGWLREEAKKRNLPFIDAIGKLLVNRAIKKSRKLLANEPVPDNDEELDSIV